MPADASPQSLYVHVPFCVRKCAYCDFYSVAVGQNPGHRLDAWLDGLELEAASAPAVRPRTVYIGGGTPTALPPAVLERLLAILRHRFPLDAVEEFTVEANPGCLSADQVQLLLAAGVNRMSLGVQSMDPRTLATLGRIHDPAQVRTAVDLLRQLGLRNLSLDIMFAVPGQTTTDCLRDVEAVLALRPEHLSVYGLMLSTETPLGRRVESGELQSVADDPYVETLEAIRDRIVGEGFEHYEISNYALPHRRCRHNLTYWHNEPYLGLGPAAASYIAGRRWTNVPDVEAYVARLREGRSPCDQAEELSPEGRARETAMLNLRTRDGLFLDAFRQATGFDPLELFAAAIAAHVASGLLELTADEPRAIRLTPQGLPLADTVLADFVS